MTAPTSPQVSQKGANALTYPLEKFGFTSKADVIAESIKFWNPSKTAFWQDEGIPLVIGDRHDYILVDVDGHELIDMHLNGGTYNVGHRNPRVVAALTEAMSYADAGNHHFPAIARTALARELIRHATPGLEKVVFGSSGGEAVDAAIKSARYSTQRRKIISIQKAYHGHTGLAVAAGDARFSQAFKSDQPDDFVQVPFNDLDAMERALAAGDAAAVIMETIPATYGFPMPKDGYLAGVKQLTETYGALYIADEVQTGLMRTGKMWAIEHYGVAPDILVTAKGLSGGIYPITAALLNKRAAKWLDDDGFGHVGTFAGTDVGSVVALEVLDIVTSDETRAHVEALSRLQKERLAQIQLAYPDVLVGIRQNGLVIGLEFADAVGGAKPIMRGLYERGVWAIFSTLDPAILQWKTGLLLDMETANRALDILEAAIISVRKAGVVLA